MPNPRPSLQTTAAATTTNALVKKPGLQGVRTAERRTFLLGEHVALKGFVRGLPPSAATGLTSNATKAKSVTRPGKTAPKPAKRRQSSGVKPPRPTCPTPCPRGLMAGGTRGARGADAHTFKATNKHKPSVPTPRSLMMTSSFVNILYKNGEEIADPATGYGHAERARASTAAGLSRYGMYPGGYQVVQAGCPDYGIQNERYPYYPSSMDPSV